MQIPFELFDSPRYNSPNSDAKMIYGLLLDRKSLSEKNAWVNELGIYLIYKRKHLADMVCISENTVNKHIKSLAQKGLVFEKRQGKNRPNLIFVGKIQYYKTDHVCLRALEIQSKDISEFPDRTILRRNHIPIIQNCEARGGKIGGDFANVKSVRRSRKTYYDKRGNPISAEELFQEEMFQQRLFLSDYIALEEEAKLNKNNLGYNPSFTIPENEDDAGTPF